MGCSRDATKTPRGAVDEKACVFTAKSRVYRKKEKNAEKDVGSGETIMRILRMRYIFSTETLGFSICTSRYVLFSQTVGRFGSVLPRATGICN